MTEPEPTPIAVWIASTPLEAESAEHRLARRLLNAELGRHSRVLVAEIDDSAEAPTPEAALDRAVRDWLSRPEAQKGQVLVVRDAWLAIAPGGIEAIDRALTQAVDLDCMLPMQPDLLPSAFVPDYQTLHGLERFQRTLIDGMAMQTAPPAGYKPALFMVRTEALRERLREMPLFAIPAAFGERCGITPAAYVHPLPDYYASDRADILPLIPSDTRSLLDIGCGTGAFGALVANKLGCRTVGVELVPGIARLAARRLDRVLTGDALSLDPGERFDCVTCLDSLEHIADPEPLLSRIRERFLRPGGHLVITVPNVGHWSVVIDQIAGRWDYVPSGLLCETHRRFYTEHSLRGLLARQGFRITRFERIGAPAPEAVISQLTALTDIGLCVDRQSLDTMAFHLIADCNP